MELSTGRAHDLGDAAFDGGVDVLVGVDEDEHVPFHLAGDLVECREHIVALVGGQQADPGEAAHVGPRSGDVVTPQDAIEGQADGVGQQRLGWAAGESAVPERPAARRFGLVGRVSQRRRVP